MSRKKGVTLTETQASAVLWALCRGNYPFKKMPTELGELQPEPGMTRAMRNAYKKLYEATEEG